MSNSTQSTSPFPPPPRPLTARGRQRSWGEPRVRVAWLFALLLGMVSMVFVVRQTLAVRADTWLLRQGELVTARIEEINGRRHEHKAFPDDLPVATMLFTTRDGQSHKIVSRLKAQESFISPKMEIPLRVNPERPTVEWTDRQQMPAVWQEFTVAYFLVPAALACLGVALWRRRRVLGLWREGEALAATVMEVKNNALAPLSRQVLLTAPQSRDRRLIPVLLPVAAGIPEVGEVLWLVVDPGHPQRAIAAKLYQE